MNTIRHLCWRLHVWSVAFLYVLLARIGTYGCTPVASAACMHAAHGLAPTQRLVIVQRLLSRSDACLYVRSTFLSVCNASVPVKPVPLLLRCEVLAKRFAALRRRRLCAPSYQT